MRTSGRRTASGAARLGSGLVGFAARVHRETCTPRCGRRWRPTADSERWTWPLDLDRTSHGLGRRGREAGDAPSAGREGTDSSRTHARAVGLQCVVRPGGARTRRVRGRSGTLPDGQDVPHVERTPRTGSSFFLRAVMGDEKKKGERFEHVATLVRATIAAGTGLQGTAAVRAVLTPDRRRRGGAARGHGAADRGRGTSAPAARRTRGSAQPVLQAIRGRARDRTLPGARSPSVGRPSVPRMRCRPPQRLDWPHYAQASPSVGPATRTRGSGVPNAVERQRTRRTSCTPCACASSEAERVPPLALAAVL